MKIINNKYRVIKNIGKGASGQVYLVLNENDDEIALKLLNKNFKRGRIRRLKKEFNIMKSLNHKNIAKVYEFDYDKSLNSYYFTLEYISGGNFRTFNNNKDSIDILLDSFSQILTGLNYLHFNNNIHYDLSENNVLIKIDDNDKSLYTVKITDFGLSSKFDNANKNEIVGTLDYISPEMYNGEDVDHRTDIFSVGMILLNLLDNYKSKFSYLSIDQFNKIDKEFDEVILKKRLFKLSDNRFKKFLIKMLEIDPELRISSANKALNFLNKTFDKKFEISQSVSFNLKDIDSSILSFNKEVSDKIILIFNTSKINNGKYVILKGSEGSGKTRLINEFKIFNQFIGNGFINLKISELKEKGTFAKIDQLQFFFKKFLYFLEYDLQGNIDRTSISELIKLLKIDNFYKKENYDKFICKFIKLFDESTKIGNRYIISIENIESAESNLLNFITYFFDNLYDKLNHFYIITINPDRVSKDNFHDIMKVTKKTEKNIIIPLTELSIEQIEFLFKSYFNGIRNIPKFVYQTIQKFSGNNLNRVNYLFKLLYNKDVIVKNNMNFVLSSKDKFKKTINEYIIDELLSKKKNLCQNKKIVLHYLALSSIPLSLIQLSKLTSTLIDKLKFIIGDIRVEFFIEENKFIDSESNRIERYLINNDLTRNVFISLIPFENIVRYHYEIASVINNEIHNRKNESKNGETSEKDFYHISTSMYIHSYLGKNRSLLKSNKDLNLFKKELISKKLFDEYLKLNDSIIQSELEFVSIKDKVIFCYENIVLIYEKQLKISISKYINLFNLNYNSIENDDELKILYFNFNVVKFISISYSEDSNLSKIEKLFKDDKRILENIESILIKNDRSQSDMEILINLLVKFFEHVFVNLYEYKRIFFKFILFVKSDPRFKHEYYYLRLLNNLFLVSNEMSDTLVNKNRLMSYENKNEKIFSIIKEQGNTLFISKSYHLISKFYSRKTVSKTIKNFFEDATNYLEDKIYVSIKYDIIYFYAKTLKNSYFLINSLKAINLILNDELNFNYINEIIKLMYERVALKKNLEFQIDEILDELQNIIEYKNDALGDIHLAYEELIFLQYERGDFERMSKLLDKYLFLMNSRKRDLKSIDCYLKYNLIFFKINEVINNFSNYLDKLGISDDEFLDIIIEFKERTKSEYFLIGKNININSKDQNSFDKNNLSINNSNISTNNTEENNDSPNNQIFLTNDFIIDYINFFIFNEEQEGLSNDKKDIDMFLERIKYTDKESTIYKRAKIIFNLIKDIDYNTSLNFLYKDIKLLYKKGYLNTAHKLSTAIAKFVFYYKKDSKSFLKFAELSLKIISEVFNSSKKEYKIALEKNDDIILLKDIIRYIKNKAKSKSTSKT